MDSDEIRVTDVDGVWGTLTVTALALGTGHVMWNHHTAGSPTRRQANVSNLDTRVSLLTQRTENKVHL